MLITVTLGNCVLLNLCDDALGAARTVVLVTMFVLGVTLRRHEIKL
jgi:hypothetical protein